MDVTPQRLTYSSNNNFGVFYFILVFGNYFTNIGFSYLKIEYSLSIGFFIISLIYGLLVAGTTYRHPFKLYPVSLALL
jgi:hypothetical protein